MSAFADELRTHTRRLASLWPALKSKPEHVAEVEQAVLRHEPRLTVSDLTHGFDEVIANCPTTGWPPGPHEVLGCVLGARKRRLNGEALQSAPRSRFGGLTFAEWWHTLPPDERPRHATLARMMGFDTSEPVPSAVPLHCTESGGTQSTSDTIQWEAA